MLSWAEPHLSKHRRRSLFINVTSLVDVLFILLIFFAVSTTFEKFGSFEMNLPKSKTAQPYQEEKSHQILVRSNGQFILDGVTYSKKTLLGRIAKWPLKEKTYPVVLKADFAVPYGEIVELLDALRAQGILKVQALTKPDA